MGSNKWIEPVSAFMRTRQNLPHLQDPGSYYFTATNTRDRRELSPAERDLIFDTILFHKDKKYLLDTAVVMPDHFHMILKPLPKPAEGIPIMEGGEGATLHAAQHGYYSLPEIFHSVKSYAAKNIAANDRTPSQYGVARTPHPTRVDRTPSQYGVARTPHPTRVDQISSQYGVARTPHPTRVDRTPSQYGVARTPHPTRVDRTPGTRSRSKIKIFQDENYDHIIRNEKDYQEKYLYLIMNPVEAGLVDRSEDYRWLYCPAIGCLGAG